MLNKENQIHNIILCQLSSFHFIMVPERYLITVPVPLGQKDTVPTVLVPVPQHCGWVPTYTYELPGNTLLCCRAGSAAGRGSLLHILPAVSWAAHARQRPAAHHLSPVLRLLSGEEWRHSCRTPGLRGEKLGALHTFSAVTSLRGDRQKLPANQCCESGSWLGPFMTQDIQTIVENEFKKNLYFL